MTTVIVPVDFSETSLNAATYAAKFLKGQAGIKMIIYHSYAKDVEAENILPRLEDLKRELTKNGALDIEILDHKEEDFVTGLERAARHRSADLVIMGITDKGALAQTIFGSNTLKMAATKACPVLIIPEKASFNQMENVMLASNFKNTLNTTPSVPIKKFLSVYHPQLHVVNVDKDHYISLTEVYEKEKQDLKDLLAEYNPEFYFMRLFDTDEAIELFSKDRHIDLIIAVQKDQSFLEKIFSDNTTKKMTYKSKLPILILHQ